MALLQHRVPDGTVQGRRFVSDLSVGSASDCDFRLPSALQVAPRHAVVSRSSRYQVPVLVDLAGQTATTRVNGRRVVQLKVLRHKDRIEMGRSQLQFWELYVQGLAPESTICGQKCLVCYEILKPGDRIITCPRCEAPHHQECWLYLTTCSYYGCGYPIQETLRRVLASHLRSEKLEEGHELVRGARLCRGGQPRDQSPFKECEQVAYCPSCETPFHFECWLSLPQCPVCRLDVSQLVREALDPTLHSESPLQGKR